MLEEVGLKEMTCRGSLRAEEFDFSDSACCDGRRVLLGKRDGRVAGAVGSVRERHGEKCVSVLEP